MSGEPEVLRTIKALAAQGYESSQLTFNAESDWLSLIWLSVIEDRSRDAGRAIAKTVLDIDPGAVRI